jgi:hypothetical protein
MRFLSLPKGIPNKDVPRQEHQVGPFRRVIVNKASLLYVSILSLSFNRLPQNGLDGDTRIGHAGSTQKQAFASCANHNTPMGTEVPRTVLTLIFPDAVSISSDRNSIPILRHLHRMLMVLRNPSGLCRNLRMLFRILI